jgi:hypothetical protein
VIRRGWAPPVPVGGWPAVADSFFFLAHSDRSGNPRLHQRALAAGLGAALLAELVLARWVEIDDQRVMAVSVDAPADPVAVTVLSDLVVGPERAVAGWLTAWEEAAYERVVGRLLTAGQVEMVPRRRFLTSYVGYQSVNRTAGAGVEVRLEHLLSTGAQMSPEDAALCGLVMATGLSRQALWRSSTRRHCRRRLIEVVDGLRPSLLTLMRQTETAVGSAIIAPG